MSEEEEGKWSECVNPNNSSNMIHGASCLL